MTSAKNRIAWFEWYAANGRNASATARHFGISRQTLAKWHKAYRRALANTPPSESSEKYVFAAKRDAKRREDYLKAAMRDHRRRQLPEFAPESHKRLLTEIAEIRVYIGPRWGRGRIHAELAQRGISVSPATVGRALREVERCCPVCGQAGSHDQWLHGMHAPIQLPDGRVMQGMPLHPTVKAWRRPKRRPNTTS